MFTQGKDRAWVPVLRNSRQAIQVSYAVSVIFPCKGREELTKRAIECLVAQNVTFPVEVLWFTDCCPIQRAIAQSSWFEETANKNPNVHWKWSDYMFESGAAALINDAIEAAEGEYIMWYANDDEILPNHIANYYCNAVAANLDFAHFDSVMVRDDETKTRFSELKFGRIGHSEIIVRSKIAKACPPHGGDYGHDWWFIVTATRASSAVAKINDIDPTYIVNLKSDREILFKFNEETAPKFKV